MAGNEPAVVVRWAVSRLNADATLTPLIADSMVYAREIPSDADTVAEPGIVVQHEWTDPPEGAIQTGANTHSAMDVHIVTRIVHQAHSTAQMEAVLIKVVGLLDNIHDQTTADGYIYTCVRGQTPELLTPVGNESIIEWPIQWVVTAKAT